MSRMRIPAFLVLVAAIAGPVIAGSETRVIDPLPEKDMSYFKQEGAKGWKLDVERDDVYNLLVCERQKQDSWLVYARKPFKDTFQVRVEVEGGSKNKGLEFYIVPKEGDRIQVPLSKRFIGKKGWHKIVIDVDEGKAVAKIDDDEQDAVEVPEGEELGFAFKLLKRSQAALKKLKIRYLVVSEEQTKVEEGFVRIFDGKSLDGWKVNPEGSGFWKLGDQRVEGKTPERQDAQGELIYEDARFRDYVLKFRASGDTRYLRVLCRYGLKDQYPAILPEINGYFAGDKDWNDVEIAVKGPEVVITINGNKVWSETAKNEIPSPILLLITPGGRAKIRDIRVRGDNQKPGPSWARYVRESGGGIGSGDPAAGGPGFGGRRGDGAGGAGGGERKLFDGESLTDWDARPPDVWSVAAGRILGLTLERKIAASLRYKKFVFPEYRLKFKVEKGSTNVTFVAKSDPHRNQPDVTVLLKPEWFGDRDWTEIEVTAMDDKLTVKVAGKVVHEGKVWKDAGYIMWQVAPESAFGVKDISIH